jgi:cytochrome c1
MSLAIYAERLDSDTNNENNDNSSIGRKRMVNNNNKTQKRSQYSKENNYSEKVNSVLQKIHSFDEQNNNMGDFKPIPPPTSAGVQATIAREPKYNETNVNGFTNMYSDLANQDDETQNKDYDYYKRFVPNYQDMYKGVSNYQSTQPYTYMNNSTETNTHKSSNDILIEKLNYMIHLLEEQQDERTNNVTEEVILYSFLGIFIIFIVDSFARVGKYIR